MRKSKKQKRIMAKRKKDTFNSFTAFCVSMADAKEKFKDVYDEYPDLIIIPSHMEEYMGAVSKGGSVMGMDIEFNDNLEEGEFEVYNVEFNLGYDE